MADVTKFEDFFTGQWSRPNAENPRLAAPISATATTITFTNPLLDEDDAVVTKQTLIGIKDNNGYTESVYIPASGLSADGLTATGCVRGIDLSGLDPTTGNASLAVAHDQDDAVFNQISAIYFTMMQGALQGTIASGGTSWQIGDETDVNITVFAANGDANKPAWRYNATGNEWEYSNDGTTYQPFGDGSGLTGGDGIAINSGAIDVDTSETTVFVKTSSGAGDEDKVPVLDSSGQLASGFIPSSVDVQTFSGSGTWTKPSGASAVYVVAYGAGGGAGGAEGRSAGNARYGGSAGGGGVRVTRLFQASELGATETVTIGSGGTGGAGGTNADGSDGTAGGNTTFGSFLTAYGGGAGRGGQNSGSGGAGAGSAAAGGDAQAGANSVGGSPTDGTSTQAQGYAGAAGVSQGDGGVAEFGGGAGGAGRIGSGTVDGGSSLVGGAGGGGGGGVDAVNSVFDGGDGGDNGAYSAGGGGAGASGGAAGSAGSNGTSAQGGQGGGGGGSNGGGTGGVGGAGGTHGGGGGGGGGGTNTGGAGGAGGDGYVYVYSW